MFAKRRLPTPRGRALLDERPLRFVPRAPVEHGGAEHVVEDLVPRSAAVPAGHGADDPLRVEASRARPEPLGGSPAYRQRSSTACAIFVPGRRHEVVEEPRDHDLARSRRGPRARARGAPRRSARHRRARPASRARSTSEPRCALDLPEPLEHELEVRRLDAPRRAALVDEPATGEAPLDPAGRDLVERPPRRARPRPSLRPAELRVARSGPSIAERAAARVRWSSRRTLPNKPGTRRLNASSSASASSRTPSSTCTRQVGSRQDVLELVRERASVAAVIEDVLLHLVEHEIELLAVAIGARSASASASGMSSARARGGRATASDRIVAPRVDDHRPRRLRLAARPPARARAAAARRRRAAASSCRRRSARRARSAARPSDSRRRAPTRARGRRRTASRARSRRSRRVP